MKDFFELQLVMTNRKIKENIRETVVFSYEGFDIKGTKSIHMAIFGVNCFYIALGIHFS